MEVIQLDDKMMNMVLKTLSGSEMMGALEPTHLTQMTRRSVLLKYSPGEIIIEEGRPASFFCIVIHGEIAVLSRIEGRKESVELGRLVPPASIGEIGVLLETPHIAAIQATQETMVLQCDQVIFRYMFENFPGFGLAVSRFLARRARDLSMRIAMPHYDESLGNPPAEVQNLLPLAVIIRHRILPLRSDKNTLYLGCITDPDPYTAAVVRDLLPSMEIKLVRIKGCFLERVIRTRAGLSNVDLQTNPDQAGEEAGLTGAWASKSPQLDALLNRMLSEGATDLHLPAGQNPYWRLGGKMVRIMDGGPLASDGPFELVKPVLDDRAIKELDEANETDFSYIIPGSARFRFHLYRDGRGISAAVRVNPSVILNIEQLGLPPVVRKLCHYANGIILIAGLPGSGKSTTLAAVIDYFNKTRSSHIITVEERIEFVYTSDKSLINQRECGMSAECIGRGLKATLREDPDIVMIDELHDPEVMMQALEIAGTGRLVVATIRASTAVGAISQVIDTFPPRLQKQARYQLGETLRGVVCQTLCKRTDGGKVAAFEVLVINAMMGNMIREDKVAQVSTLMQTGRSEGHVFLNESLYTLVNSKKISGEEAFEKSQDKEDLKRRIITLNRHPVSPAAERKEII